MLLLLDLDLGAVLEGPLDNVRLFVCTLHELALANGGPEFGEVLEFDEVPVVSMAGQCMFFSVC